LHLRAAKWYSTAGQDSKAIEHYLTAKAYEMAADLIEINSLSLLSQGEVTTLESWVSEIPEELVKNRPRLALAREWAFLVREPAQFWTTVSERMAQLERIVDADPESVLEKLADVKPGSARLNNLCEFAILEAFVVRQAGDLEHSIALFKGAVEYLADDAYTMKALGMAGLASVYGRRGALRHADHAFSQAVKFSFQAGSIFFVVVCTGFQALTQTYQGHLEKAKRSYQGGIDLLTENLGPTAPLSGQVWAGLADIFREQNDLETALEYVNEGVTRGERVRDHDALRSGYVTLARVQYALGHDEGYQQAIHLAKQIVQETRNPECINEVACWEARLEIMSGNLEEARQWAIERRLPEATFDVNCSDTPVHNENTTYVRLLMAEGRQSEALKLLNWIAETPNQDEAQQALIETLILQARCLQSIGKRDDAMRKLAQALLMAEPDGYARLFLDEGHAMAALLRAARAQGHSPEYVRRLLAFFGKGIDRGAPLDPLSERELEVLNLVTKGYTNREIATELIVEVSTVKTHINRIYSKLGVNNRTQAVIRAQEMGLV
jgi:LuxR family maltose regulon positive regulatory protein